MGYNGLLFLLIVERERERSWFISLVSERAKENKREEGEKIIVLLNQTVLIKITKKNSGSSLELCRNSNRMAITTK